MKIKIIVALAVLAIILFFKIPNSPDEVQKQKEVGNTPTTLADEPSPAPMEQASNEAVNEIEGERQVREDDANEVAKAFVGSPEDRERARKAKLNNSGVLQAYEKLMAPWISAREHSRRAVACGLRSNNWRVALLSEWNSRMLNDEQLRRIKFAMTHDEFLAAEADDAILTKWLNDDALKCEDLQGMPFLARYDLVAAGVGPLPGM